MDDGAKRPASVKASLSVAFGQRAPNRAGAREEGRGMGAGMQGGAGASRKRSASPDPYRDQQQQRRRSRCAQKIPLSFWWPFVAPLTPSLCFLPDVFNTLLPASPPSASMAGMAAVGLEPSVHCGLLSGLDGGLY